jgi:hypothetical protein
MFPDPNLLDLQAHPKAGPGLYILDQNTKGLVPRALL